MRTLICGSMAFDTIMVFHDHFKNHILPEQIHILNVAFLVPDMRREYGGCAGNIAYNMKLLGGEPVIMATVGDDFAPYAERVKQAGPRFQLDSSRCQYLYRTGFHHHRSGR
jgi:adenosine kinase